MRHKETLDWEEIRRFIRGIASEEEKERVEDWRNGDVRRKKFMKSAERYYAAEKFPVVDEQQINRAWQRFRYSLQRPVKKIHRQTVKWSVAAVLLLGLGCGGWLYWQYRQPEAVVTAQSGIQPGQNTACLILSDGRQMELRGQEVVRKITDQQVDIRIDTTGLVYLPAKRSGKPAYNTILVPRGGEYRLTLADGSKVWLNAQSKLVYPVYFTEKERRIRLAGEAYFEVKAGQQPFIVETEDMEVRVLGTHFNVSAYADEETTATTLVSGQVEVNTGSQQKNILFPGQQAIWDKSKGETHVREVNALSYIQWKEGRFVFRNMALKDIMRTLGRWYNMEYEFTSGEAGEITFYGLLNRYQHIEELLQQFEKTGKVQFTFRGNKIYIE